MRWWWRVLMLAAAAMLGSAALADSWMPPERKVYLSPDGQTRLTVTPRGIASALGYFEDKVQGREPAGQAQGTAPTARGLLERQEGGRWVRVWEAPLVNDVVPVSALVANGGAYVATFDNWHSVGLGRDVVVLYRGDGSVVRALALSDILPADYIAALPRSVSSLWWSGTHRIDAAAGRLVLQVVVPEPGQTLADNARYVDVAVELATGAVVPPRGRAWDDARAQASAVAMMNATLERLRAEEFRAPLLGPESHDEREWHDYLREAFYRRDPDWKEGAPSTLVLRAPAAKEYTASEKRVRTALSEAEAGEVVMLAAPAAPERLAAVVGDTARQLGAGSLRGVRVYVAGAPAAAVAAALAPGGAEVIALDPAVPIPQRPERLNRDVAADLAAAADALTDR